MKNYATDMNRQKALRSTRQRKVIFEELCKLTTHPTADEMYQIVKKKLPRISLGTVYRNLEVLSKTGAIKKLRFGEDSMRYDGNTKRHYHASCLSCGRLDDLPAGTFPIEDSAIKGNSDYKILSWELRVYGTCSECSDNGLTLHKTGNGKYNDSH